MKKEIKIITEGESDTERVFNHLKNWCFDNFQGFQLEVKGKDQEGKEKTFECKQEKKDKEN